MVFLLVLGSFKIRSRDIWPCLSSIHIFFACIQHPAGYFTSYLVFLLVLWSFKHVLPFMSSIWPDICPYIQYLAGYLAIYLVFPCWSWEALGLVAGIFCLLCLVSDRIFIHTSSIWPDIWLYIWYSCWSLEASRLVLGIFCLLCLVSGRIFVQTSSTGRIFVHTSSIWPDML